MRKIIFVLALSLLSLPVPIPGQDRARAILDKAISAVGGPDKLSQLKALRATYQCTAYFGAVSAPCSLLALFQWPDQLKTDLRCDFSGQKFILIQVIDGDKAWRSENGQTQEAKGHVLTELQEGLYFQRVETLLPLTKGTGYTLSPLDEIKVKDRAAVGIRVSSKGHRDISLYFDKETALLVKSAHYLPDLTGKEIFRESIFSDYRDIDGSKQFMRMEVYQDGKIVLDAKVIEIKFMEKIEANVFSKP